MNKQDKLIEILKQSITRAEAEQSKIPTDSSSQDNPLSLQGMSGKKTRHFLNNLCSNECVRYIEVGLWKGSTLCSAMYNNKMTCMGIDNWSQFGPSEAKKTFYENLERYQGDNKVCLFEQDFRTVANVNETAKFEEFGIDIDTFKWNVLFFDGPHLKEDHAGVIKAFEPILDDSFILIIDDWNSHEAVEGTRQMLSEHAGAVVFEQIIRTPGNNPEYGWHNGIAFFVIAR